MWSDHSECTPCLISEAGSGLVSAWRGESTEERCGIRKLPECNTAELINSLIQSEQFKTQLRRILHSGGVLDFPEQAKGVIVGNNLNHGVLYSYKQRDFTVSFFKTKPILSSVQNT